MWPHRIDLLTTENLDHGRSKPYHQCSKLSLTQHRQEAYGEKDEFIPFQQVKIDIDKAQIEFL